MFTRASAISVVSIFRTPLPNINSLRPRWHHRRIRVLAGRLLFFNRAAKSGASLGELPHATGLPIEKSEFLYLLEPD